MCVWRSNWRCKLVFACRIGFFLLLQLILSLPHPSLFRIYRNQYMKPVKRDRTGLNAKLGFKAMRKSHFYTKWALSCCANVSACMYVSMCVFNFLCTALIVVEIKNQFHCESFFPHVCFCSLFSLSFSLHAVLIYFKIKQMPFSE